MNKIREAYEILSEQNVIGQGSNSEKTTPYCILGALGAAYGDCNWIMSDHFVGAAERKIIAETIREMYPDWSYPGDSLQIADFNDMYSWIDEANKEFNFAVGNDERTARILAVMEKAAIKFDEQV